jgi:uncharacterized protein YacL
MSMLNNTTNKEEKYDVTEEVPKAAMKEAVEQEFTQKPKETNRIVVDTSVYNNLRVNHICECSDNREC